MRELKFRAYIKPLKRYATGLDTIQFHKCCDVEGAGIWSVVTINEGIFECDDIILEQYTGLKDKNGKEIYEGDIVSYLKSNYEIYFDKVQGWRGIRRGSHSIIPIGETVYNMTINQVGKPEVIGNIHEREEEE